MQVVTIGNLPQNLPQLNKREINNLYQERSAAKRYINITVRNSLDAH